MANREQILDALCQAFPGCEATWHRTRGYEIWDHAGRVEIKQEEVERLTKLKLTRGRQKGQTSGPTGPQIGSRPWALVNLKPGDSLLFEVKVSAQNTMQQIATDLHRNGISHLTQDLLLAIQPRTREVVEIVRVRHKSDT